MVASGVLLAPAAQAKFKASRIKPEQQERTKLQVVRQEYDDREHEFLTGWGGWGLQNAARRLMDSEIALTATEANQKAIRERYWARLKQMEIIYKARYEQGQVPIQTYAESKRAFRDAEIMLLRARAKTPKE